MGLSCSCPDFDGDGWWYYFVVPGEDKPLFNTLKTKRRVRCCSCKELVSVGDECLDFARFRSPNSEIEERIYGDEVPLADWIMCQKCGEMYYNLESLGFCVNLSENMFDLVKEYKEMQLSKGG